VGRNKGGGGCTRVSQEAESSQFQKKEKRKRTKRSVKRFGLIVWKKVEITEKKRTDEEFGRRKKIQGGQQK